MSDETPAEAYERWFLGEMLQAGRENDAQRRAVRRCPRTWPHEAHGPWSTAEIVPGAAIYDTTFDCPGVPYEKETA